MIAAINFVLFLWRASVAYWEAERTKKAIYASANYRGVCVANLIVGFDRSAWEVSQVAIHHFGSKAPAREVAPWRY